MRTSSAVLCSLLLLSMTLSGCVSQNERLLGGTTGEGSVDEVFEGLDYVECMNHEEMERCWNVFVPKTVNLSADVPLVLDIHGNTLTMENQRDLSQFDDIAEENGVVAVWPQGHDNSWNSGYCCSTAGEMQLNDTGLILEIVDRVVANHSIDESRIYLTGWSNGCSLSQKLANDHSEVFAAVACMSYYLLDDPRPEYSPIPIMDCLLYTSDAADDA